MNISSRIAPGYSSDTIGHFNLLAPAAFLSGLSTLTVWLIVSNMAGLMALAAVYGLVSGTFISMSIMITPAVASISGRGVGGNKNGNAIQYHIRSVSRIYLLVFSLRRHWV